MTRAEGLRPVTDRVRRGSFLAGVALVCALQFFPLAAAFADDCLAYLKTPGKLVSAPRWLLEDCARTPFAQAILTTLAGTAVGALTATALSQALKQAAQQAAQQTVVRAGEAPTLLTGAQDSETATEQANVPADEATEQAEDEAAADDFAPDESPEDPAEFDPPPGNPEDAPEEEESQSERPECDEIYARYNDAVQRYREAQGERDAIKARLDRAMSIHQANQLKLIVQTGVDVGGLVVGGGEAIHEVTKTVVRRVGRSAGRIGRAGADEIADGADQAARRATGGVDEIRRARIKAGMMAESARQLQARIKVLQESCERLQRAQEVVDRLARENRELDAWFRQGLAERYNLHPGMQGDHAFHIASAEVDTNRIAREAIEAQIAKQGGSATAGQLAELARLREALERSQRVISDAEDLAHSLGFKLDTEEFLKARDPVKFERSMAIQRELDAAQREMKLAERAAPPYAIAERNRLQNRLDEVLKAQAGVDDAAEAVPPDLSTRAAARPGRNTVIATKPPTVDWEIPKPPDWLHNMETGVEDGIAYVLSPFARAYRWAFGGGQTAEEVAKIIAEGREHINQLMAEFEAKQAEIDAIRADVQSMKADLEACNRRGTL